MRFLLAALLASLLAVACSSAGSSPSTDSLPASLAGTAWKAVSVVGQSTVAGREPTIAFEATKVSGSGGCNQFGGEYTYADGRLTFGEMPMTLMGCEEPISTIETAFMHVLAGGVTVELDDGNQLLIEGPGGQALLVPTAAP